MLKKFCLLFSVFISTVCFSQIQVFKLLSKDSKDFKTGFGVFLRFNYPVSEADDISLEGAANFFLLKDDPAYGWATVPVKLGYRYTFDRSGSGFYILPQAGYNVFGVNPDDDKFTGPVVAGTVGYLFATGSRFNPDLGIIFESAFYKKNAVKYIGLRFTQNIMLRRRDY